MRLKLLVPLVHAIHLVAVLELATTSRNVAFGPFAKTSGDLAGALDGVGPVVTQVFTFVRRWCSSPSFRSAMRKLVFIVKSASLISPFEVALHSICIMYEFALPRFLWRKEIVPLVQNFKRKLDQTLNKKKLSCSWTYWRVNFTVNVKLCKLTWSRWSGCRGGTFRASNFPLASFSFASASSVWLSFAAKARATSPKSFIFNLNIWALKFWSEI